MRSWLHAKTGEAPADNDLASVLMSQAKDAKNDESDSASSLDYNEYTDETQKVKLRKQDG